MTTHVNGTPLPAEDPGAQALLLSAALNGPEGVAEAVKLHSLDFTGAGQHIHAVIVAIHRRGGSITPETVADELDRTGHPGAAPYLHTLYKYGIPGPQAGYYADRMTEAATARRLLASSQRIAQLADAEPGDTRRAALLAELDQAKAAVDGLPRGATGRTLNAVSAAGRSMRAAKWLMDQRIPMGAITLLTGREGIGKSTASYDIISQLTNGTLEGANEGRQRGVGIVATEDAWEEVIIPRLTAAGADLTRVFEIEARSDQGLKAPLSVPGDLTQLATTCATHDIALLVLDPLMSVMPSGIDTHKDKDVRTALDPLATFCATTGVATLALIHVNKSSGTDPLNAVMASKAFTAVARSVLYCIVDPDAEHQDRYLMGHPKSNLGRKQPSLAYRITEVTFELEPEPGQEHGEQIVTSRIVWDGEDDRTIATLMEPKPRERPDGELSARILDFLAVQLAAVPTADIAAALPDVKRGTLDKQLKRLFERDRIARPFHGHYASIPDP